MRSRNRHRTLGLGPLYNQEVSGISRKRLFQGALLLVLAVSLVGCDLFEELLPTGPEDEQPLTETTTTVPGTGNAVLTPYPTPTSGVAAPEARSPAPGSEVTGTRPTLVVNNSETGEKYPLTYSFEVALDEGFANIVASAAGVAQGGNGRTSWQVSDALEIRKYYWRSRARAGFVKSPFSSVSDFVVAQEPEPTPTIFDGEADVYDPLTKEHP